ncbi:MAG: hypothetical protein M5U28_19605 [Sandaracinaceae bacterium]|nr:hypothetical protein [Sandaracinaceae bacterium]
MHASSTAPRSTPLAVWLVAALLAGACDGEALIDAGEPPRDGGRDAGALDASPPADGGPAPDDADAGGCATHHDCDQGSFCHRGACRVGDPPVHHCDKPGCPPGQWCVEIDGARSICPEDPTYACSTACDCGPAHCCLEGRCVRDDGDPWSGTHGATSTCPVGPDVPPADRLPTYCATDPACHAASQAWRLSGRRGTFLAHDPGTGQATATCSGERCFGTACNCGLGESCVETIEQVATGTTCGLFTGGTCMSNAIAESVFAVPAAELLGCCADGCRSGERCDAGWMHRGNRRAYERVVAECAPAGGCTCGDGSCCPEELRSCAADCTPERCSGSVCQPVVCGDARCDPFEDDRRCPADCPTGCGDGVCGADESEATCSTDCSEECGDGWCSAAELTDTGSCPADCDGRCADADLYGRVYRVCGDGVCDRTSTCDYQDPESCASCPEDCGACDWEIVDVFVERPVRGTLRSVWVNAPDEVFVGANEGYVYRFDGAGWHLASHVLSGQVEVWGPGPSAAFAIGDAGGHRYDGRSWGEIVVPAQIAAVWGTAADHVLALSRDAAHRYDGHAWTASPLPSPLGFYIDVWGTGPSDVWVADEAARSCTTTGRRGRSSPRSPPSGFVPSGRAGRATCTGWVGSSIGSALRSARRPSTSTAARGPTSRPRGRWRS